MAWKASDQALEGYALVIFSVGPLIALMGGFIVVRGRGRASPILLGAAFA